MELDTERSVEDNELLDAKGLEENGEIHAKLKINGNCDTEIVNGKIYDDIKDEVCVGKEELEPLPAMKGKGLRKWRRIRRESGSETNSYYLDSNRKRGMITLPAVMKQRSEDSSSSTNAMSNAIGFALDHTGQYRDFGAGMGPGFSSRADSENSEDRNSRSSTAGSAPVMNRELPVLGLGFGDDTIRMNSGILVQSDQQEKIRNVKKKARGVRIKKENSISSMGSDSRSSNFFFMTGSNSITSNGRSGRLGNHEEDDSDDAQNGDRHLNDEVSKNEVDYECVSHEDLAGEKTWEVKEEKADDHVGTGNQDDLVDSIMPLHFAQEALAREVQKLRDVGKEETLSSDDWFKSNKINEVHLQSKLEEAFVMLDLKNSKIAQLESTLNYKEIETEFEELLTQRTAAELEYLVILKTVENLKGGLNKTSITLQQKNIAAATTPELVHTADAGETKEVSWKLKNKLYRYTYCFIIQSVLLLVVLYMFVLQFSSKTVDAIPT
ncbi:WPP domain-interacting protein 2-like [Rutidosis leptorrhynchoides]|uniref:WPP domain-interacting protein 2-like n=1 Tax=Rutidosis leptorrhynchoides TaxID=125765 RepID=UPI003A9917DF